MICRCYCCIEGTFLCSYDDETPQTLWKTNSVKGWVDQIYSEICVVWSKKFCNCCLLSRQWNKLLVPSSVPQLSLPDIQVKVFVWDTVGIFLKNSLTEGTLVPEMYRLSFVVRRVLQKKCVSDEYNNKYNDLFRFKLCRCYYCTLTLLSSFYN